MDTPSAARDWLTGGLGLLLCFSPVPEPASAQDPCTTPAAARPAEVGCYFTAADSLGVPPAQPLYWHLYTYPTRAAAARATPSQGIVVEVFHQVWRYTIAPADWRPSEGHRIAVVGPLPTVPDTAYIARYMEAVFRPGMHTRVHRHSGAEAWYVLSGAQCLETPEGITVARAGESAVVRAGPPMMLSTVGRETRRAVLLVLHPASQPWTALAEEWSPKSACPP